MSNNHKNSSSKQEKKNPILEIFSCQNEDIGYKKPIINPVVSPMHVIDPVKGANIGIDKDNIIKGDD